MIPCLLRIRKKTLKPTKRAIVHKYRSDWITVGVITSQESINFLSRMKYDSQFAKYLNDNYGVGIYSVLLFRKGQEGFRSFMKVECKEECYTRLKKTLSIDEKEKIKLLFEKRRITRRLKEEVDSDKKDNLNEDLNDLNEFVSVYDEITDSKESGCYPYLKSLFPFYREHSYDEEFRERAHHVHRSKIVHEDVKDELIEEARPIKTWR